MYTFLSWIGNVIAGSFSVVFLACAWVGLISIVFSFIGTLRKKCKFYAIFIYLGLSLISVSTGFFWTGVVITGIILLISIPKWLKDLWIKTNK
jgi:hypothetical protein